MISKNDLFASIEWAGKNLYVYGYISAEELKKISNDFKAGIEVRHPQIEKGELTAMVHARSAKCSLTVMLTQVY
ncbi:MAG: hypothetical protein ABI675_14270 [Chitinophagaceae bacterium]